MKALTATVFFFLAGLLIAKPQGPADTSVYLLTCAPGNATYSIYGHSALRVVIPASGIDVVYNWGVFDFNTKNFAWKFARGRLNYMLGVYPYEIFLRDYFMESRSVSSRKVNIEKEDLEKLMVLLSDNLKPENLSYRYDFFYDNCATRIRDLFEKIYSARLIYPPEEPGRIPTFREKLRKYQLYYPWLNLGIDFLLGMPADKKASFRNVMFLPDYLEQNLARAVVNRNRMMVPLLGNAATVLEFDSHQKTPRVFMSPMLILGLFFVIILVASVKLNSKLLLYTDIFLFSLFSLLSLMMVFFGFFTDHAHTKWNLNLIWSSPLIFICLVSLVLNKNWHYWFRLVLWLSVIFMLIAVVFPGKTNIALVPVAMILALRSSARAGMISNPFSRNGNMTDE